MNDLKNKLSVADPQHVPDPRTGVNWIIILALLGIAALISALAFVAWLYPVEVRVRSDSAVEAVMEGYHAAGRRCNAATLVSFSKLKRQYQAAICAAADEDERKKRNSYIQAARSADAAQAQASYAFAQARIAAVGGALSVVTMFAATLAAIYAGVAAYQNKRSATAAAEQVETAMASERAYLVIRPESPKILDWINGANQLTWEFRAENFGRTPAFNVAVRAGIFIPFLDDDVDRFIAAYSSRDYGVTVIPDEIHLTQSSAFSLRANGESELLIRTKGPPLNNFEQAPYRKRLRDGVANRCGIVWLKVVLEYQDTWGNKKNAENLFTVEPSHTSSDIWNVFEAGGDAHNKRT